MGHGGGGLRTRRARLAPGRQADGARQPGPANRPFQRDRDVLGELRRPSHDNHFGLRAGLGMIGLEWRRDARRLAALPPMPSPWTGGRASSCPDASKSIPPERWKATIPDMHALVVSSRPGWTASRPPSATGTAPRSERPGTIQTISASGPTAKTSPARATKLGKLIM